MSQTPTPPPQSIPRSHEFRFGLVMYGGVSLAIYINGVSHELFRAVRGRGVYRLIKALTDSDVVLDVLSGSSAGGINAILLAYALCNRREFSPAAQLWRDHGDIGDLLRKLDAPAENYVSLLDSEEKYEPYLREAFERLDAKPIDGSGDAPSPLPELDLFITGTDFYGRLWKTTDDRGRVVDVKDHRTVFWLKHRALRKEPFNPSSNANDAPNRPTAEPSTTHAALARLARITSCFPGAFTPVRVGTTTEVDRRLRRWGQINSSGDRIYIDGGVLDNKPFSSTLEAIYSRLAERPVSRWLLYVDPDPEQFTEQTEARLPNIVQTGLSSLVALPGYESIAEDLRVVRQHNERTQHIDALRQRLMGTADGVRDVETYHRTRLVGLRDHIFASLFTREIASQAGNELLDRAQLALREWFDAHLVQGSALARLPAFALDVDYRLRRLMHLIYNCAEQLQENPPLLKLINRQVQLLEIVRHGMESVVEDTAATELDPKQLERLRNQPSSLKTWAEGVWARLLLRLMSVATVAAPKSYALAKNPAAELDQLLTPAELEQFDATVRAKVSGAAQLGAVRNASRGPDFFLAARAFEWRVFRRSAIAKPYRRFRAVDAATHPLEVLTGMCGYDKLRVARISPLDSSNEFDKRSADNLNGRQFGHFGAFFKKSWRSNDILWGRLDAVGELLDLLLDVPRIERLFCGATLDARVQAELRNCIPSVETAAALDLEPDERDRLLGWLNQLADSDWPTRKAAAALLRDPDKRKNPKTLLRSLAQRELVRTELRQVLRDAEQQQVDWNRDRLTERNARTASDRELATLSARTKADLEFEKQSQTPEALSAYFKDAYQVGRETISDIPPIVVADWIARAVAIAEKSLLAAAGPKADLIRTHPIYQVAIGWPLRALAGMVGYLRASPSSGGRRSLMALAYIVLSIVVVLLAGRTIVTESVVGAFLFAALPLVLIVVLRLQVSLKDGSGMLTWLLRACGWGLGLVAALALGVSLASTRMTVEWSGCHDFAAGPVYCNAMPMLTSAGRVLGWIAMLLGLIAVTGLFGTLTRKVRACERQRREAAAKRIATPATEFPGTPPAVVVRDAE